MTIGDLPACFITFEGTEGVGKTTAIERFCARLTDYGIRHIRTREPGGSELAETLRDILLNNKTSINSDTELLLMFAARADHLHHTILPALTDGQWVVCDRFYDSSVAYQGFGRYFGEATSLAKLTLLCDKFVSRVPDLTFWLDLDPNIGRMRAGKRSVADRFERETALFFERVYQGFLYQYNNDSQRIVRIDADGSIDEVMSRIWRHASERLHVNQQTIN